MSKNVKIGICKKSSEKINDAEFAEVLTDKGAIGDQINF
jgi:hypothetical protein